jgi:CubicO group peptidase (beta-lactamase class C family)
VREHVYAPATMTDTDAHEMDLPVANLAIGYTHQDEHGRFDPDTWRSNIYLHVVKGGPAGGGFSTIRDLLRFDRALRSGTLTSPPTSETLWTGKIGMPLSPETHYAYGFVEDIVRDQRIVGHSGGFAGINAQLDMYLDSGYTVAVMANVDPPVASHVALKARELFTG